MKSTSHLPKVILALVALLLAVLFTARAGADERAQLVARGDYLVNRVGLCADCHTPRNERGEFLRDHWLKGAPLGFKPLMEMPWSPVAPPIAGLPSLTDEQAVQFFTQGTRPDGSRPRPPMPEYQFSPEDARAVTAYLRALPR